MCEHVLLWCLIYYMGVYDKKNYAEKSFDSTFLQCTADVQARDKHMEIYDRGFIFHT